MTCNNNYFLPGSIMCLVHQALQKNSDPECLFNIAASNSNPEASTIAEKRTLKNIISCDAVVQYRKQMSRDATLHKYEEWTYGGAMPHKYILGVASHTQPLQPGKQYAVRRR